MSIRTENVQIQRLKQIQMLLKHEQFLEHYQKDCIPELAPAFEKIYFTLLRCRKILLYVYTFSTHHLGQDCSQMKYLFNFLDFNNDFTRVEKNKDFNDQYLCKNISTLLQNPKTMMESLMKDSLKSGLGEDNFNKLMFSTIPSLFGCFLNESAVNLYLDTLAQIEEVPLLKYQYFIIPLYFSSSFLNFINTIFTSHDNGINIVKKYFLGQTIDEITREQFKIDFFSNWVKYINLFPKIIKDAICCQKSKEKQKELFCLSFNEILKTSPETLYFNYYCLNIDLSPLVNVFDRKFCDKLWGVVLLNDHSLTNKIFMIDQFSANFTYPDLQLIQDLYNVCKRNSQLYSKEVQSSIETCQNDYIETYIFKCPDLFKSKEKTVNTNQSNQNQEIDIIGSKFSEIILNTGLIELQDGFYNPFDILRLYVPPNNGLLELKIEDFIDYVDNLNTHNQKWTFERLLNVVRVKFEQRTQERLKRFQDFEYYVELFKNLKNYEAQLKNKSAHFHKVITYLLIKEFIKSKSINIKIDDNQKAEFCKDDTMIQSHLNKLLLEFRNWFSEKIITRSEMKNNMMIKFDQHILYNFILQQIPMETFLNYNQDIRSDSRYLFFSNEANKKELLKEEFEDKCSKIFTFDQNLIEPHIKELKTIFELNTTPLILIQMIYNIYSCNTENFVVRQKLEKGPDRQQPLFQFIFKNANTINRYSQYKYCGHFLKTINVEDDTYIEGQLNFLTIQLDKLKFLQLDTKKKGLMPKLSQLEADFKKLANQETSPEIEKIKQLKTSIDIINDTMQSFDKQ